MNRIPPFVYWTLSAALLVLLALIIVKPSAAAERDYQKAWCDAHGGQMEVVLTDNTRADCVTNTHAIEFDFAPKWAEAIGQALHYAALTGKQPGIVLIMAPGDEKFRSRLVTTTAAFCLRVELWEVQK
jgi:hypothetical protein